MQRPAGQRASASALEVSLEQLEPLIRWDELFGNPRPVELEIGCGKGLFLATVAEAHPELNFFGLERAAKYLRRAIDRAEKRGLGNVRFVRAAAEHVIMHLVPSASLHAVHIYYPDPWPKKRHHKRRLLGHLNGPLVVGHLARVLRPGGWLSIATDHEDYQRVIGEVVGACAQFERSEICYGQALLPDPGLPLTEFERKYRREGRERLWLCWRRKK